MDEKILDLLEEISGTDEVKKNMDIKMFDEGILDSLSFIEVLLALDERFNISIDPTEIDRNNVDTPNKFVSYIGKLK